MRSPRILARFGAAALIGALVLVPLHGQDAAGPVNVKFQEPKTDVAEMAVAVNPLQLIRIGHVGNMSFGLTYLPNGQPHPQGGLLCCGDGAIRTMFKVDGAMVYPNSPRAAQPLPATPTGKARPGVQQVWGFGDLRITQWLEHIPSRPSKPGEKRAMDTVLVKYLVENLGPKAHTFGTRVRIDSYCIDNDGALFASPTTHPNQILNGILLKEKSLPEYVQILQRPNLKDPGFVGHFTLKLGQKLIGPDRFACTFHGAPENGWEVAVGASNGDSDCVLYWEPRSVPAGGKIEMAYAYGKGLASTPDSEGRVSVAFGGSFEPNKLFTVSAYVDDPMSGQSLTLELPKGVALVEGRAIQPVPQPMDETATSLVQWRCRVSDLGEHTLRIRSSTGVTQTRTFTVTR